MKIFRSLLCVALVAVLLCASAVPAFAANKLTFYASDNSGERSTWENISIEGYKAGAKITGVKSSNKNVATVYCLNRDDYSYHYYEDDRTENHSSASIELMVRKPGTAKISYKVDNKAYTQEIEVLKYVNPVKVLKITGIGTTNLRSAFAKQNYADKKLKKNAKEGMVQVTAASGWKIRYVEWRDDENDSWYEFYSWGKPVSSAKLHIPGMTKGKRYYVWLRFVNTKTGAEMPIDYYID